VVTALSTGEIEFKVFAPAAASVEVLGSFTGWSTQPVRLADTGEGWWTGRAVVSPGDHDFQYRINGETWMADFAAYGVRLNQFGQWESRLAVPKAA